MMNSFWKFERKWQKFSNSCNSIKFLWANHYFINFSCRDFNAKLKLHAIIKIRAKFKTAQLATFLLCRDIKLLVTTYSALVGISHPLAVTAIFPLCIMMSRQLPLRGICSLSRPSLYLPQFTEHIRISFLIKSQILIIK